MQYEKNLNQTIWIKTLQKLIYGSCPVKEQVFAILKENAMVLTS
jgi:hypothetical protein